MDKNLIITKPMSLIREDFIASLTRLINETNLPMFVIEPIIKDIYNDVRILSAKQIEKEKTRYEEAIKQAKEQEG